MLGIGIFAKINLSVFCLVNFKRVGCGVMVMARRFCPKCGSTDKDMYKGFCKECYLETHEVVRIPKKIVVTRCPACKSIYVANKLVPGSRSVIEKMIKKKVETDLFSPSYSFEWEDNRAVNVTVTGSLDPEGFFDVSVSGRVKIEYKDRTCWVCSKKGTQYYEVEVQLRGDPEEIKEVLEEMLGYTEILSRYHPEAELVYTKEVKEGINVYYGYKPIALRVLNYLHSEKGLRYTASEAKMIRYNPRGRHVTRKSYCIRV